MDINFIPHPLQGTPYGDALDLAIILAIACWLLSVITREYSWVDRLWTICPAIYCLIVAVESDFGSTRLNIMTLLVLAWAARLTFNSARKGGYSVGGEDYRWKVGPGKTGADPVSDPQFHLRGARTDADHLAVHVSVAPSLGRAGPTPESPGCRGRIPLRGVLRN